MNQLKSIYNSPFKDLSSHPIHTCFLMVPNNVVRNQLIPISYVNKATFVLPELRSLLYQKAESCKYETKVNCIKKHKMLVYFTVPD